MLEEIWEIKSQHYMFELRCDPDSDEQSIVYSDCLYCLSEIKGKNTDQ